MVKANEELTAQAKANADLLISVRKEAANHDLAAKMAMEHAQDMINGSYIGGESYLNLLVVISPLEDSHILKEQKSQSLMINLYPMHKTLMFHQVRNVIIIQKTMMFHQVRNVITIQKTMMVH